MNGSISGSMAFLLKSGDVEKNAFTNMKRQLMGAMDIGCIAMIRLSFDYLSQVQAGICDTLVEEAGTNAVIPYRLITDFDDIRNIFLNALKREGVL